MMHLEFNELAMLYIPAFRHFAPFYTVGCLVIFYFFKSTTAVGNTPVWVT